MSPGQLFALEYLFSQALLFLAFGVGLDPRQGRTLGPAFAPSLVGIILALGGLCSNLVKLGYTGMCKYPLSFRPQLVAALILRRKAFNPARCLGLMAAKRDMQYHYVHWLAVSAAAVLNGLFYHLAPPWAREAPLFRNVRGREDVKTHQSQA